MLRQEIRSFLVGAVLEIPDDVIGGEFAAVMPGDPLPEMDDPAFVVVRIDFVRRGETRFELCGLVGFRSFPQ